MRSKGLTINLHMEHGKHCFSTSFDVTIMSTCLGMNKAVEVLDSLETPENTRVIPAAYTKGAVVSLIFGAVVHFRAEIKVLHRPLWNVHLWPDVWVSIGVITLRS